MYRPISFSLFKGTSLITCWNNNSTIL